METSAAFFVPVPDNQPGIVSIFPALLHCLLNKKNTINFGALKLNLEKSLDIKTKVLPPYITMQNTFGINIIPDNEDQRLEVLKRYKILDTPPEGAFNNIAKLATQIFGVPISLISLVDKEEVFFKANIGMGSIRKTSRGISLCSLAVLNPEVTVFEDATAEPCLLANPLVAGEFGLKFYAGAPITTHDGFLIGTLCIVDKSPRQFSARNKEILKGLAEIVMDEIELRLSAMDEIEKHQSITEKKQAINIQLSSANKELLQTQEDLSLSNDKLANSERRMRYLLQDAPIAIAVLKGRELVIESANKKILEIWAKKETIVGKTLAEALPELQGQQFLQWLDDVFTKGQPFVGTEVKVIGERDGKLEEFFANFVYQPIKNMDGTTDSIMVVATVVTQEVKTKQQLKESEENLRTLADNISQLAWMGDETGSLNWYNKRWFDYTGTTLEEMQGWGWQKVHHPDHVARVTEKYKVVIAKGEIWEDTFPLLSKDGEYRWFLSRAVPLKDEAGKIIRWFGTNTDITEQLALSKQKDDFLGVVSHELKTPITSLKGSLQLLELLKETPENPMLPTLVNSSLKSTEKIIALVEDLLNMRSFEEGQLRLEKTTFTIAEMLNVCCNHVRMGGKYELIIEGDKNIQVYADEHRIDQVVVNFVNNAVKYAPASFKIYMCITREGNFVKIAVRDSGPGIPAEQLPHLFDRYWRASHKGGKYSGLGLGLYICAQIIERHGGKIGAESELGKGSSFWFTLPLSNG